jgi:predicted phosphodiesterase
MLAALLPPPKRVLRCLGGEVNDYVDSRRDRRGHSVRFAIISDIHGNFAALEAVVRDLEKRDAGEVFVGGDLALGGRQPAEVLDYLIERRWPSVLGNTDALIVALANGTANRSDADFPMAAWAVDRLRPYHLDYLKTLPTGLRHALPDNQDMVLVHATPWSITEMVLPGAQEDVARKMLREARAKIVAYGHIHCAYHRKVNGGLLVSVGGVSWSNDRNPLPAYSVLTIGREVSVEVHRVSYDAEAELVAVDQSGLPLSAILRKLLRSGGSLDQLKKR